MYSDVRAYFRAQMNSLGFKEWKDAFNEENIPSTLLDGSYHLGPVGGSRNGSYDQRSQTLKGTITIRVARKGYRTPADALDRLASDLDRILVRTLAVGTRNGTLIKNVYFDSHRIEALGQSNDNVAVLEISFSCDTILDTEVK